MHVEPIVRERRREAAAALVEAFHDDAEAIHLLPGARTRARVVPRFMAADCADSQVHDTLLGVQVDRRIVGVAGWLPPGAYPIPLARQAAQVLTFVPVLPWAWPAAIEARRGQAATRARHPHEPHWFLRVLGVVPAWQGNGIGHRLIEPVLDRADDKGVGAYLVTTKETNVAFYRRFGFAVTDEYRPTPTWPLVWSLWREPRT